MGGAATCTGEHDQELETATREVQATPVRAGESKASLAVAWVPGPDEPRVHLAELTTEATGEDHDRGQSEHVDHLNEREHRIPDPRRVPEEQERPADPQRIGSHAD